MSANTDFERLMLDKKLEVLKEINDTKVKILKELYSVNTRIHTCYHDYVNDYNQIRYLLEQELVRIQNEHEKFKEEMRSLYGDFVSNIDEYIYRIFAPEFDKLNGLTESFNQAISKVNEALAKVADLEERMLTDEDVDNIVNQVVGSLDGFVTEETFSEFVTNISNLINESLVNPDWNEDDPTKKSHIFNRTHYGEYEEVLLYEGDLNSGNYEYNQSTETYDFELPFMLDYNELSNVIIEFNNVKYNLPFRRGSIFKRFIFKESEYSSTSTRRLIKNTILIGAEGYIDNVIPSNSEIPFIIYFDDFENKFFLSTKINNVILPFKLILLNNTNVKYLKPSYMGENGVVGSHLILTPKGAKWEEPPIISYYDMDYHSFAKGTFVKYDNTHYRLETPEIVNLEKGKTYHITVEGFTGEVPYTANGTAMLGGAISIRSYGNYIELTINNLTNFAKYVPKDYENLGIEVDICLYEMKHFKGKIDADYIAKNPSNYGYPLYVNEGIQWSNDHYIVSDNGSVFKLTVDDNGSLSTTPITT